MRDSSVFSIHISRVPFKASARCGQDFKKKHKIRHEHVTKYICAKDNVTFEETVKVDKLFQKQLQ
jgi:hypothetical protein